MNDETMAITNTTPRIESLAGEASLGGVSCDMPRVVPAEE